LQASVAQHCDDEASPLQYVVRSCIRNWNTLLVLQDRQQKLRQIQAEIETVPLRRTSLEAQLQQANCSLCTETKARQVEVDRKEA